MAKEISKFIEKHYRHFNAARLVEASKDYSKIVDAGGKMFVTLAGAMSTAELGKSLAEMIRQGKVHAICCTGANLEEDLFNLVAHNHYKLISNYRLLSAEDETKLCEKGLNRVTDTCIPEDEAMRRIEKKILKRWQEAEAKGQRLFPHEFMFQLLKGGDLKEHYEIDPKDSWMLAAAEKNLPMFVPGWEDSTLGNMFVGQFIKGNVKKLDTVKIGTHYMLELVDWYSKESAKNKIGFFQIGGGIAGDFPICVVPLINQDLKRNVPLWSYFCQISDSTTSYGSYSGATPNEKISWGKLEETTPSYVIESDATIVAPLIFAHVLGW